MPCYLFNEIPSLISVRLRRRASSFLSRCEENGWEFFLPTFWDISQEWHLRGRSLFLSCSTNESIKGCIQKKSLQARSAAILIKTLTVSRKKVQGKAWDVEAKWVVTLQCANKETGWLLSRFYLWSRNACYNLEQNAFVLNVSFGKIYPFYSQREPWKQFMGSSLLTTSDPVGQT